MTVGLFRSGALFSRVVRSTPDVQPKSPFITDVTQELMSAPALPPVAYVHKRLSEQLNRNLGIIDDLENQIKTLNEELRQRQVIHAALTVATDALSADSAIDPKEPKDVSFGVTWSEVLERADAATESRDG